MVPKQLKVVHVDDDSLELRTVEKEFKKGAEGYTFVLKSIKSIDDYKDYLASESKPDAVILDVHFKGDKENGLDLAKLTRSRWPKVAIIIRTTDHELVQRALAVGADEFVAKLSFEGEICLRTIRTIELVAEKHGSSTSNTSGRVRPVNVGIGSTMKTIASRISRIVDSGIRTVHVFGESGTGKEVVADMFESVLGKGKPFIRVNCGAISESLFESELFGVVKGAFTGADRDKDGLIDAANGGFLFLDEIATVPESSQVKLLRVIENQENRPVGSSKTKKINVRIVTATNEDLPTLIKKGKFRNDLHQRLCEAEIKLPPLRDRPEEISELIAHFAEIELGGPYRITEPAIRALASYTWDRGNIRELRNCIRAMTENHMNKMLTPISIPASFWERISDPDDIDQENEENESVGLFPDRKITLKWDDDNTPDFKKLSDQLMLTLLRQVYKKTGASKVREHERAIGLSRTAITNRLRDLVNSGVISEEEMTELSGLKM